MIQTLPVLLHLLSQVHRLSVNGETRLTGGSEETCPQRWPDWRSLDDHPKGYSGKIAIMVLVKKKKNPSLSAPLLSFVVCNSDFCQQRETNAKNDSSHIRAVNTIRSHKDWLSTSMVGLHENKHKATVNVWISNSSLSLCIPVRLPFSLPACLILSLFRDPMTDFYMKREYYNILNKTYM